MKYTEGDKIIILDGAKSTSCWNSNMNIWIEKELTIKEMGSWAPFGLYVKTEEDGQAWMWFENMFKLKQEVYEIY